MVLKAGAKVEELIELLRSRLTQGMPQLLSVAIQAWGGYAATVEIETVLVFRIEDMLAALQTHAKYPMPASVAQEIAALGKRYGLTVIEREGNNLLLKIADLPVFGTAAA